MFKYTSPEECGISPKSVKKYVSLLEKYGLSTHSVIMARGDKIFFEQYWEPFNADFTHRLYSVTKSYVAIAIGFLVDEGKVSLDEKIVNYFKNDLPENLFQNVEAQTVRNMLMMSTGFPLSRGNWFADKGDRVRFYFDKSSGNIDTVRDKSKIPGSFFEYDSNGSFILGSLVERVSGKTLVEYLREKLFDKIGVSDTIHCLKCPGGHSWSDSALLSTPLDLLKVARFTLNYGEWNGEQLLSRDYLKEATSSLIDNSSDGLVSFQSFGYGYQIWKTWQDSFFFNGMGCQFAICVPHKDMILIYNGDNQGNALAKSVIIDRFFEEIVDTAADKPLTEDKEAQTDLKEYCKELKLYCLEGKASSDTAALVSGKEYTLENNPMGITKVKFTFDGDRGVFEYTNPRGDKKLPFGMCKNLFTKFPESYSDEVGSHIKDGHEYNAAISAAWREDDLLGIMVQVIDEYFGRLYFSVRFLNDGRIAIQCTKTAEDFFHGYGGYASGQQASACTHTATRTVSEHT